jgi:photosystem II stability/assembly factor-like uncharacterized protein
MKAITLIARIGIFALILSLGTSAALIVGETKGLALADLSGTSVRLIAPAANGNVMYTVLSADHQAAGIYRSKDSGKSWQNVGAGPVGAVSALIVHPTQDRVVYAGTAGGPAATTDSLWRSPDGGRTWRKSFLGLPTSPEGLIPGVSALAVDPRRPEIIYVGTTGHGVYRFNADLNRYGYELMGGVSLYTAHVKSLVVGPQGRVYALTNQGLFVSDGGTWQELLVPEMAALLAVAPDDPKRLYAGSASTGMYRSTDGGQTWERANNGIEMIPGAALRVTALSVDENNPRHVVAATSHGVGNRLVPSTVYESGDGGFSWERLADADHVVTQLVLNQGAVYAATEGGMTRYDAPSQRVVTTPQPRWRSGLLASLLDEQNPLERLSNPTGVQLLIMVLTVLIGGLALVGRVEWVLHRKTQAVQAEIQAR